MKLRKCASIMAFAIELADMDGDGDLDLVHHSDDRGNFMGLHGTATVLVFVTTTVKVDLMVKVLNCLAI